MKTTLAFPAPPPLSSEERKITRNAIAPLVAMHKYASTQLSDLTTPEAAIACLGSFIAWGQRYSKIIGASSTTGTAARKTTKAAAKAPARTRSAGASS